MTGHDSARNARLLLGTAFTGAGIAHVLKHKWFEGLVPEPLAQWRKPISAVTAIIQIVGGISMFVPRLRSVARWTNLAMLVPTLPAAADQIRHPEILRRAGVPPQVAPVRVVMQSLVAVLTWWATRPTPKDQNSPAPSLSPANRTERRPQFVRSSSGNSSN